MDFDVDYKLHLLVSHDIFLFLSVNMRNILGKLAWGKWIVMKININQLTF